MSDEKALESSASEARCDAVERDWEELGSAAALDRLIARLSDPLEPRALLDALLLKARLELGLPAVMLASLGELAEPVRSKYEDRYVEALRRVGSALLERGEIAAAWPYFRTIGEREAVARALEGCRLEAGDERIAGLIDVALYGGAHPLKGFGWVLEHYGTCSAISAFEHLPAEESVRGRAAAWLIESVHTQLAANLRAELARSGQVRPDPDLPIPALISGRDWLFEEDGYHIDVSHLAAVVRMSPLVAEKGVLLKALELCEYGSRLSPRLRYDDAPPFEKTYESHAVYLKGLLGRDVEGALSWLRGQLGVAGGDGENGTAAAQALVRLLVRLGRWEEAMEVAIAHLADSPQSMLSCPGAVELCVKVGRLDRLVELARARGDDVGLLAARIAVQSAAGGSSDGAGLDQARTS